MKRIGILFGQERTFPQALIERINREGGDVVAEPVKVGGVSLDSPRRYDLILDRISQDIPFYRAILKKAGKPMYEKISSHSSGNTRFVIDSDVVSGGCWFEGRITVFGTATPIAFARTLLKNLSSAVHQNGLLIT